MEGFSAPGSPCCGSHLRDPVQSHSFAATLGSSGRFRCPSIMASFRFPQLVRQFTTSAVRQGKLHTPPIQVFGIEGRYATALYSAALKENKLDAAEKDATVFKDLLVKDRKLREFIANPSLKRTVKRTVLEEALKKKQFSPLFLNLVGAMSENGRINKIGAVVNSFGMLMSAHRGEVVCVVKTAKPLDGNAMSSLKSALEGFLKKGEVLHLQTQVDTSLIGGMVVSIGDRYIDMSTATKIKNYTNLLKQAV